MSGADPMSAGRMTLRMTRPAIRGQPKGAGYEGKTDRRCEPSRHHVRVPPPVAARSDSPSAAPRPPVSATNGRRPNHFPVSIETDSQTDLWTISQMVEKCERSHSKNRSRWNRCGLLDIAWDTRGERLATCGADLRVYIFSFSRRLAAPETHGVAAIHGVVAGRSDSRISRGTALRRARHTPVGLCGWPRRSDSEQPCRLIHRISDGDRSHGRTSLGHDTGNEDVFFVSDQNKNPVDWSEDGRFILGVSPRRS
jgi:hypothetical protein